MFGMEVLKIQTGLIKYSVVLMPVKLCGHIDKTVSNIVWVLLWELKEMLWFKCEINKDMAIIGFLMNNSNFSMKLYKKKVLFNMSQSACNLNARLNIVCYCSGCNTVPSKCYLLMSLTD
jgi:hypothetical protein